jgi:hypothetical protein
MAVVTVKSTQITNRDAVPRVISNPAAVAGAVQQISATAEAANGDSIASKYILGQIPSNAFGEILKLYCDAITSGAADIGIYRTTIDGGAVVDVDFYGSAVDRRRDHDGTEIQHEADATDAGVGFGLADLEKPLWQRLQFAADPGCQFDIVATLTAATTAAGTIGLRGSFAV